MNPRLLVPTLSLAVAALLLSSVPALAGSKYGNPRVGAWKVESGFGHVTGGAMSLSAKRKVTKLVALPGEDYTEACGKRVELVGKPKLKSYKSASERWALARVRKGLFVPTPVKVKTDGKRVAGSVKLIWDSPKLASGQIKFGDCNLNFTLRAK